MVRKVKRLRPCGALPVTVDEAVERLMRWLSDEQLDTIARRRRSYNGSEPDIVSTRMLGLAIRNEFGLWNDESPLRDATGKKHPDNASAVIMRALWRRLKKERKV
jgi:hypothetical protein